VESKKLQEQLTTGKKIKPTTMSAGYEQESMLVQLTEKIREFQLEKLRMTVVDPAG